MNEFAAMMKYAEAFTPIATIQMQARCTSSGSRVQPKIHSPMKVDSKKKATRPSIASGAPKMSPTNREYSLQFIPNWNSWTMPVATPMREVDQEQLAEEPGQPVPGGVPGDDPDGLHHRDQRGEADRQRDEDEVVDGGDPELPPRHVQRVHVHQLPGCGYDS